MDGYVWHWLLVSTCYAKLVAFGFSIVIATSTGKLDWSKSDSLERGNQILDCIFKCQHLTVWMFGLALFPFIIYISKFFVLKFHIKILLFFKI